MNPLLIGVAWLILKPKKPTGKRRLSKSLPDGPMSDSAKNVWKDVFGKKEFSKMTSLGVYSKRNIQGTNTPSQHSYGNAIDFAGTDREMNNLQTYLESNAKRLKVNYVIHNREVSKQGGVRKKYTGTDPHTSHVHADFLPVIS